MYDCSYAKVGKRWAFPEILFSRANLNMRSAVREPSKGSGSLILIGRKAGPAGAWPDDEVCYARRSSVTLARASATSTLARFSASCLLWSRASTCETSLNCSIQPLEMIHFVILLMSS